MKFETVIIGGGLAGLCCGIRLARAGVRAAIVSSGQSALHFSSGSLDLLSTLPDGSEVESPVQAVEQLVRQSPDHPYAKLGVERFRSLAVEAKALLAEAGINTVGDAERNHYRLTPVGVLKPTWLTLAGYVFANGSEGLAWRRVALFNAEGFLDFYPQFIADELRRKGTVCDLHTFNLPALEHIRQNPTEMRSANIARIFDREQTIDSLAEQIKSRMGSAEAVLLPAVLGVDCRDGVKRLEQRLGVPVAVVATLPPSVPGLQTQTLLRRYFQELGGTYMLGDTVTGYRADGNRIEAIYTANHGDVALRADDFVLATGSYFSGGLVADNGGVVEPIFGLDVDYAANRSDWYRRDMFEAQPYERFGVKCDQSLRPQRRGRTVENIRVVGASLAGFNPVKEGCGAGVSILTAMCAADEILSSEKR